MRHFKDLPIKRKLLLIIMSINLFALILAFAGFMAYDIILFRQEAVRNLSTMADVIGHNCSASLVFYDQADARETLAALKAHESIVAAWIFTEIGNVLARYVRDDIRKPAAQPEFKRDGYNFKDGRLISRSYLIKYPLARFTFNLI